MIEQPELPTSFRRQSSMYNVLPDDEPMTWGVWDLEGWLGEITLDGDRWAWRHDRELPLSTAHDTWQAAADEMIGSLPGMRFD